MIGIIGNGLAGLTFARICQIKQWDYQIIAPKARPAPNKRIMLNNRSVNFLKKLSLIKRQDLEAFTELDILQRSHLPKISLRAKNYHVEALAFAINYPELIKKLKHDTIEQTITHGATSKHSVTLSSQRKTQSFDFVIGCDGQQSIVRHIAGIPIQYGSPIHCLAIPANIPSHTLIQRFSKNITGAVLPGTPGMIVLTSSNDLRTWQFSLQDLQKFFKGHAQISQPLTPIFYQLTPSISASCYQNRCLLLGNAALTISPIAAQGFNQTLRNLEDIMELDQLTEESLSHLTQKINARNRRLYKQMEVISLSHPLMPIIRKSVFCINNILPIIEDHIMLFGNRDA